MQFIDNITSLVKLLLPTRLRRAKFVLLIESLLHRTYSQLQSAYTHYIYEYKYSRYTAQIASLNEALSERFGPDCYIEDGYRLPTYFGEGVIEPEYRQIVPVSPPFIIGEVRQPTYSCVVHIPLNHQGYSLNDVDLFLHRYVYTGIIYTIQQDSSTVYPNPNQPPVIVQM